MGIIIYQQSDIDQILCLEGLNYGPVEPAGMKRLIILGDPGLRKGGTIEHDGSEQQVFSVSRNGEWHGPDEVQLWCIIGTEDEKDDFQRRNFVPHFLDTERVDAEAVDVVKAKGDMAV